MDLQCLRLGLVHCLTNLLSLKRLKSLIAAPAAFMDIAVVLKDILNACSRFKRNSCWQPWRVLNHLFKHCRLALCRSIVNCITDPSANSSNLISLLQLLVLPPQKSVPAAWYRGNEW